MDFSNSSLVKLEKMRDTLTEKVQREQERAKNTPIGAGPAADANRKSMEQRYTEQLDVIEEAIFKAEMADMEQQPTTASELRSSGDAKVTHGATETASSSGMSLHTGTAAAASVPLTASTLAAVQHHHQQNSTTRREGEKGVAALGDPFREHSLLPPPHPTLPSQSAHPQIETSLLPPPDSSLTLQDNGAPESPFLQYLRANPSMLEKYRNDPSFLHPCIREYGKCKVGAACLFRRYPRDACLRHLKSQATPHHNNRCRNSQRCEEWHVDWEGGAGPTVLRESHQPRWGHPNLVEQFTQSIGSLAKLACSADGRSMLQGVMRLQHLEWIQTIVDELIIDADNVMLDSHGCHVIRSLIEVIDEHQLAKLMEVMHSKLTLNICTLSQHTRKILVTLFDHHHNLRLQSIVDIMSNNALYLAANKQGSISLLRVFERCTPEQKQSLAQPLMKSFAELACDPFGNYVVQCALEHSEPLVATRYAMDSFKGEFLRLATNKFGSNVCEKLIQVGNPNLRSLILDELIFNAAALQKAANNGFGNFVIQTLIETCNSPVELRNMCDLLGPTIIASPYGHKIDAKIRSKRFPGQQLDSAPIQPLLVDPTGQQDPRVPSSGLSTGLLPPPTPLPVITPTALNTAETRIPFIPGGLGATVAATNPGLGTPSDSGNHSLLPPPTTPQQQPLGFNQPHPGLGTASDLLLMAAVAPAAPVRDADGWTPAPTGMRPQVDAPVVVPAAPVPPGASSVLPPGSSDLLKNAAAPYAPSMSASTIEELPQPQIAAPPQFQRAPISAPQSEWRIVPSGPTPVATAAGGQPYLREHRDRSRSRHHHHKRSARDDERRGHERRKRSRSRGESRKHRSSHRRRD